MKETEFRVSLEHTKRAETWMPVFGYAVQSLWTEVKFEMIAIDV